MNAKKAKALRKMMKNLSESQKNLPDREYQENTLKGKTVTMTEADMIKANIPLDHAAVTKSVQTTYSSADGVGNGVVYNVKIGHGPIRNNPSSKRGLYQHFKQKMVDIEASRNK